MFTDNITAYTIPLMHYQDWFILFGVLAVVLIVGFMVAKAEQALSDKEQNNDT